MCACGAILADGTAEPEGHRRPSSCWAAQRISYSALCNSSSPPRPSLSLMLEGELPGRALEKGLSTCLLDFVVTIA